MEFVDASEVFDLAREFLDYMHSIEGFRIGVNAAAVIFAGLLALAYYVIIASRAPE